MARKTMAACRVVGALMLTLFVATASAQFGPDGAQPERRTGGDEWKKTTEAVKLANEENLAKSAKNPDLFARPGLLANKSDKSVRIWAHATALGPNDPLEFFLIPEDSGKEYEAMNVGFAKPSDVHAALEFIGMKPGRPVNYANNQYWPKGERVIITALWMEPPADAKSPPSPRKVRIEDLVIDSRTNKPLPPDGLVFVGSYMLKPEGSDKPVYAADLMDPKSIISDFNDIATVLDVPRQATKSTVYGFQIINPAFRFTPDQLVILTLEPEYKDGRTRVRDLSLSISMPPGATTAQAARYLLTDPQGKRINEQDSLVHLLAAFEKMTEAGQDPFLTVRPDDAMSLAAVSQVYSLLVQMDNPKGIRVDAPPEGHLYFRAFFPRPEWRDRSTRLGRPWELHLVEKDHKIAGTLILPADEIEDNGGKGDLKFTVGSADEVARILAEKSNKFSQVVYIFAPRAMHFGQLMNFIRPAMKTHPAMYIFLP